VSLDNLRRIVLREHDRPQAANIGLIGLTCRYALGHGFHTVLEGILYSAHYGEMLAGLREEYGDRSSWWFLDVPFEETVARHASKPQAAEYGRAELEQWWHGRDLLPGGFEQIITPERTAEAAAGQILSHARLHGYRLLRHDGCGRPVRGYPGRPAPMTASRTGRGLPPPRLGLGFGVAAGCCAGPPGMPPVRWP
jgi:hypothetical protein